MREKKKILSPYKRKIHINNEEWTYQIKKANLGSEGYLKVCNPKRTKKYTITIPVIGKSASLIDYEWCPEEFDGEWEDLYSVSLTPSKIKELIIEEVINKSK